MLGFSTSNGVEIKGRYAQRMRKSEERRRAGKLNKYDRELIKFQNAPSRVTLVRDF